MKRTKRFISFLLAVLIIVGTFAALSISVTAYDDDEIPLNTESGHEGEMKGFDDEIKWSFNKSTGKLTLDGLRDMYDYTVYFEDGYLAPWHHLRNRVTSVKINGVKRIGNYALYNFKNVKSVTIPDSVTSIGDSAFKGCQSLKSIIIPDSVTSIGSSAFYNCKSLTGVTVPEGVTCIGGGAFEACDKLESVKLPDTLEKLGILVFSECSSLKTVNIPEGVDSLEFEAFSDCTSLESVTVPDSVKKLDEGVFRNCPKLAEIKIGENVLSVGCDTLDGTAYAADKANYRNGALYLGNCLIKADKSVSGDYMVENGTHVIADEAFEGNKKLTSITIPDSVKTIGYKAFQGCTALGEISLGDGIECVKWDAFSETAFWSEPENWDGDLLYSGNVLIEAKEDITGECTVKEGTTLIADRAFECCFELTDVTLPASLKRVGEQCFDDCERLSSVRISDLAAWCAVDFSSESVYHNSESNNPLLMAGDLYLNGKLVTDLVIPDGVEKISDTAFVFCQSIKRVTLPYGIKSIENGAFAYCDKLETVSFPDTLESIGKKSFYDCGALNNAILPESVSSIGDSSFSYCASLTEAKLPQSLKAIGGKVFVGCKKLTSVNMPQEVSAIGDFAFYGCKSLTSITIPDGVKSIGENAFCDCNKLEGLSIPEGVTELGKYAFSFCVKFTNLTIPERITKLEDGVFYSCKGLKKVTIPKNITSIGDSSFAFCTKITSVSLPSTLKNIGNNAFETCKSLKKLKVPASVVNIGDRALGYTHDRNESVSNFAILGEKGSEAEKYAEKNDLPFNKKPNPSKYTVKTKTIKISALRTKKITVKPLSVRGAKGSVSFAKVKKITDFFKRGPYVVNYTLESSSKAIYGRIAVNPKTGAITFDKGKYKRGTYKLLLKVKVSGTAKYGSKTVIKTVRIKLK